jgi:glycosyltransferase involved in cell wall biosynthesis
MRVVLLDLLLSGHHREYASFLIDHLTDSGDEVTFVTWQDDPLLEPLHAHRALNLRFVAGNGARPSAGSLPQQLVQTYRGIRLGLQIARQQSASAFHVLYLDRSELALLAALPGHQVAVPTFATLFWPYFVHSSGEMVAAPKAWLHALNRRALRRLLARGPLRALFVHSPRIRNTLLEALNVPDAADRILVVPDPAHQGTPRPAEEARIRLGLPTDRVLFLFFGGLRRDKGPDLLLEALPMVHGSVPWSLLIAGRAGTMNEETIDSFRGRLSDSSCLLARIGFVSDEDMYDYFSAVDAVVLPYRRSNKGTSGILQRAAGAAKPVIATDVGDLGPTVREAGLGLLVEPESPLALARALSEFLADSERVQRDVKPRAQRYAAENDWRILGRKTREAYLSNHGLNEQTPPVLPGSPRSEL